MNDDVARVGELSEGSIIQMCEQVDGTARFVCYGLVMALWPDYLSNTVTFTVVCNVPGEGIHTQEYTECADTAVGVLV